LNPISLVDHSAFADLLAVPHGLLFSQMFLRALCLAHYYLPLLLTWDSF